MGMMGEVRQGEGGRCITICMFMCIGLHTRASSTMINTIVILTKFGINVQIFRWYFIIFPLLMKYAGCLLEMALLFRKRLDLTSILSGLSLHFKHRL